MSEGGEGESKQGEGGGTERDDIVVVVVFALRVAGGQRDKTPREETEKEKTRLDIFIRRRRTQWL